MAVLESVEAWDDEALDDEAFDDEAFDDESVDDESEFLGQILGGPAAMVGQALGGLLGGRRQPSRTPLPRVNVGVPGSGVATATLNTPAGNATLRLPEPVVTRREFEAGMRKLQEGINRDAARVNAVAKDVDTLRTRVGAVVADTQRDIAKLRTAAAKQRRANQAAIARMRREQSSQQMLAMVMAMMTQQQLQTKLEEHTHGEKGAAVVDSSDNSMLMMLPMMMMSGEGGSSNDMMMPMMMMIAMKD